MSEHFHPSSSSADDPPPLQTALAGVRVVSFEHAVAAPVCTRHLADMGADVIKIEAPAGDFARRYDDVVEGCSSHFVWLNAGKRSIALDLRSPAGHEVARNLALSADVVVTNLGPGVFARRVMQREDLHPSTIFCEITGYERTGGYGDRKAFDLIVQGEMGVTLSTGTEEHPAKPGVSLADLSAGMYALAEVVGALYQRRLTGKGCHLNVALSTSVAEWMSPLLLAARYKGADPVRTGLAHQTIAPYGAYTTKDGWLVNVAVQNETQWRRLAEVVVRDPGVVEDERFSTNQRRVANRGALDEWLATAIAALTLADLGERLDVAGIPWGRLNLPSEALLHPDLSAANRWRDVRLPSGQVAQVVNGPLPGRAGGAVPAVGEHTAAVLSELGYSTTAVRSFMERGILDDGSIGGREGEN